MNLISHCLWAKANHRNYTNISPNLSHVTGNKYHFLYLSHLNFTEIVHIQEVTYKIIFLFSPSTKMILILSKFSCFNTLYLVSCKILLKRKRRAGENELRLESACTILWDKNEQPKYNEWVVKWSLEPEKICSQLTVVNWAQWATGKRQVWWFPEWGTASLLETSDLWDSCHNQFTMKVWPTQ